MVISKKIEKLDKRIKQLEKLVAKHKSLERELKSSEERFKILFEEAPDGYFLSDLKGIFIDGNKAAEKLIGYKKDELIGKSMIKMKIVPLDQIPKIVRRLAEHILKKNTSPGEFTIVKKDGQRVSVEITGRAVKMQGQNLVLGIVRDISDRKRIDKELIEKNEELARINKLAIGRELKMVELKKRIRELEKEKIN